MTVVPDRMMIINIPSLGRDIKRPPAAAISGGMFEPFETSRLLVKKTGHSSADEGVNLPVMVYLNIPGRFNFECISPPIP